MPRILAIDTTSEFGSLAALENGAIAAESLIHSPEGFSGTLFAHAAELLTRAGWKLESVDVFAAASGPGSFTGVRVGIAAVKGLAEATGRRVAAVSNLEALAWFGTAPLRAAVLDARRGQVYAALFDAGMNALRAESVGGLAGFLDLLPDADIEFVSPDPEWLRAGLTGTRFERAAIRQPAGALARAVARIAASREPLDPAAIDANYVRRSDAELFWKDPL